jgi:hypothetical protein
MGMWTMNFIPAAPVTAVMATDVEESVDEE